MPRDGELPATPALPAPERAWLSAKAMADLLGISPQALNKRAREQGWRAPEREAPANPTGTWRAAGGGCEYHYSLLPLRTQSRLIAERVKAETPEPPAPGISRDEAWDHYAQQPDGKKAKAKRCAEAIDAVALLVGGGTRKDIAVKLVADRLGISPSTYYGWEARTHGVDRADWLPYLVDRRVGRIAVQETAPEAWEFLKADYLRQEQPSFASCYRRLVRAAKANGWQLSESERTLERRMDAVPAVVRVLAREGLEALKRLYPAQERDRSSFHALEAVNADGHRWDVWVKWPDGEVMRPVMVAVQDLYSGTILSWRVDRSENKEAVRLAFGDLFEQWGIPSDAWLDNGRNFAAKWITGGSPNRYRFKVRDEEPVGILTSLGVRVHFTLPYSGQSKPIERAFRDLCDTIARHPAFAGAWTGNSPVTKPENYGSRAVPLDTFLAVLASEIVEHNTRAKRESRVCGGRHSFLDVFRASYEQSPIRKATAEQRRLWLLAAEGIRAAAQDGALRLAGNRYWAEWLIEHRGAPLVVRFDPQALHAGLHVYRLNGAYLGGADCIEAVGFADQQAAQDHARLRNRFLRATREAMEAEKSLSIDQVAALLPGLEPAPAPNTKIVRPITFGNLAVAQAHAQPVEDPEDDQSFAAALAGGVRALRLVKG